LWQKTLNHPRVFAFLVNERATLNAYQRPHDPKRPGCAARQDYEYERKRRCNVFMACEPLAGHFMGIAVVLLCRNWPAKFMNFFQVGISPYLITPSFYRWAYLGWLDVRVAAFGRFKSFSARAQKPNSCTRVEQKNSTCEKPSKTAQKLITPPCLLLRQTEIFESQGSPSS
jgi:hypothetical protein